MKKTKNCQPLSSAPATLTICIQESTDEPGFFYDIYDAGTEEIEEGASSLDGGHCTTTIENALEMAG